MLKNHQTYQTSSRQLNYQLAGTNHSLGIGRINFVWNQSLSQLILLLESDQIFNQEVNPVVKGNSLILYSPLLTFLERPLHTHLIEKDIRDEVEQGIPDNGFSEIKLKAGYHYSLVSCTLTDPYMLKVILRYQPIDQHYH